MLLQIKYVLVENELVRKMNESEKVKAISTKGLTHDLTNEFSILKGVKYFCSK